MLIRWMTELSKERWQLGIILLPGQVGSQWTTWHPPIVGQRERESDQPWSLYVIVWYCMATMRTNMNPSYYHRVKWQSVIRQGKHQDHQQQGNLHWNSWLTGYCSESSLNVTPLSLSLSLFFTSSRVSWNVKCKGIVCFNDFLMNYNPQPVTPMMTGLIHTGRV